MKKNKEYQEYQEYQDYEEDVAEEVILSTTTGEQGIFWDRTH